MFVKICGLSTAQHVEAAVAAGADAVGFVFADSVRRVEPARAATLAHSVPDTVKKVAVMLHPSNEEWQHVMHAFSPDVLQTDAEDFAALDIPSGIDTWPVYREKNTVTDTFGVSLKVTDTYLYEGARSGRGETVDWSVAAGIARRGKMILAGGLSVDNVAAAIATVRPFGVDVSSAVESAPGIKDPALIEEFVNAARAAEKNL
ncbi:MAG: phosphoribosylanthranilate isomerase [Woeseiaceae bacterium]|jgi:phosphoribosylanthranilate isomerase